MNILLWVLQVLLALHTLMGAFWKFSNSEQTVPSLAVIPHGIWLAISVFEIFFALGLVIPIFKKDWAKLAPFSAIAIGSVMVIYCVLQLVSGQPNSGEMIYWGVVAAFCAFIAWGRFKRSAKNVPTVDGKASAA